MKTLLAILTTLMLISCQKENSKTMAETQQQTIALKAIANSTVNGLVITLDASKSTGNITAYGYQLDSSSPTDGPVTYSPSSSQKASKDGAGNYEPMNFIPITATIKNIGTYTFDLIVYTADGNMDQEQFNVIVK